MIKFKKITSTSNVDSAMSQACGSVPEGCELVSVTVVQEKYANYVYVFYKEIELLPLELCETEKKENLVQHFKGGIYDVMDMADGADTQEGSFIEGEKFAVYKCVKTDQVYVRPMSDFNGEVSPGVMRFKSLN